ncbi:MAG: hypothetical protein AUG51_24710 [Acidobacteria bacterium 13_1_20CM_3_53_8]|nr:MAG: hypothetical protein AUG51_24710 [Acidobacteria bacterium 13_1_20CM_3_53_8]
MSRVEEKPDYRFITREAEAVVAVKSLESEQIIGLDTETYWEPRESHSYVSLVQIAPREGEVLVFDLLELDAELLRPLVDSPSITMAAHNARFDEAMLAGTGLKPIAFVDTLRLARSALRLPSYSLAGVSAHLFGIELDKSYQKSNWRRRPLTKGQLDYAALDAHIALHVYEELTAILNERGKLDAALRSATLVPATEKSDEARPRRRRAPAIPLRPLTDDEKQVVKALKRWRFEKAQAEHLPAYMICPDRTLEHLAIEMPRELEALLAINGLGPSRVERYGREILEALNQFMKNRQV